MERAGLLERLEYRHEITRRRTHSVDRLNNIVKRNARGKQEHFVFFLGDIQL